MTLGPLQQSFSPISTQTGVTPAGSFVSSSASSRTTTLLPTGALAVDDTFVRRTIIQPNNWMNGIAGLDALAPQSAPAPARRKKKKRGLKRVAKRIKRKLKSKLKKLRNIVKKPFELVKKAFNFALQPLQLLTGGLPGGIKPPQ
jgi:hypothetical protein